MSMRLLNVHTLKSGDTLQGDTPPYAIASHRWQKEEVTFQDVRKSRNLDYAGRQKLNGFIDYVKRSTDLDWLWIDICCIDKRDKTELEYAINSMFRWYRDARVCLAYLQDVPFARDDAAFRSSEWFRRGWTLQELLAPKSVIFLSANWQIIGFKGVEADTHPVGRRMNDLISQITGIPDEALSDYASCKHIGVNETLRWIQNRQTTLEEDRAHCLLGLLDVSMRISYGGVDAGGKAMARLMAKLGKKDGNALQSSSSLGEALQLSPLLSNTDEGEHHVFNTGKHIALAQLAERLEKVSRYMRSSKDHASHFSILTQRLIASRLIAACDSLSRLRQSLEHHRHHGVLNMPLFLRCKEICASNTIDPRKLFEKIIASAECLVECDGPEVTDTACLSFLEDLEQSRTLLSLALGTYHDTKHDTQAMRLLAQMWRTTAECSRQTEHGATSVDVQAKTATASLGSIHSELATTTDSMLWQRPNHCRYVLPDGTVSERRRHERVFRASLKLPWLSRTVWDFAVVRSQLGWSYQLLLRYDVPQGSPIFKLCEAGDVEGMHKLVITGSASPRDRSGILTLLEYATYHGQINVCRYLLSQTDWSDQVAEMRQALGPCIEYGRKTGADRKLLNEETYRLFIDQHGLDVDLEGPARHEF